MIDLLVEIAPLFWILLPVLLVLRVVERGQMRHERRTRMLRRL